MKHQSVINHSQSTPKVIITAPAHKCLLEQLTQRGYDVQYVPSISYDKLSAIVADAYGLVVTTRIKIEIG